MDQLGVIERRAGRIHARLERVLPHPRASVWAALTEPAKIAQWLAPGEIGDRVGAPAKLNFVDSGTVIDSVVSAYAPLSLLEYSWSGPAEPERPVRWSLADEAEDTRLTLALSVPETEDGARACAGWEAHLEMLAAALEGVPIKFPFERFKAMREAYRARL